MRAKKPKEQFVKQENDWLRRVYNADDEMEALSILTNEVWSSLWEVAQRIFPNRTINLQGNSLHIRRKLLLFTVWEQRYKLPIDWMFEALLLYYDDKKNRKSKSRGTGLPVTVNTLVSSSSEELLQRLIEQEFPGNAHISLYRQREQENGVKDCLTYHRVPEVIPAPRTLVSYDSLVAWRRDYRARMEKKQSRDGQVRSWLKKNSRPYRGNPWR